MSFVFLGLIFRVMVIKLALFLLCCVVCELNVDPSVNSRHCGFLMWVLGLNG